ncbi:MAG: hypothetical protein U5J83_15355 [Bryobacterales bacterium]|nr:hypothetical protein [Bryobacterales bacterium]
MMYFLNRGGARYGPYTVDDVKRYIAAGNIAPDDSMEPEAGGNAVPASQLVQAPTAQAPWASSPSGPGGFTPAPQPVSPAGYGSSYPAQPMVATIPAHVPPPPSMDWWLVLLLSIFTCTLFGLIWAIVQSRWVKKVDPSSRATLYLVLPLLIIPIFVAMALGGGILAGAAGAGGGMEELAGGVMVVGMIVLGLGAAVASIAGFFSMSSSLANATAHWGSARIDLGGAFLAIVVVSWFLNVLFLVAPVWIQYRLDEARRLQAWGGVGLR